MLKKALSALLLCVALFSGQTAAKNNGHIFYKVQNPDAMIRHFADSDELRCAAEEAALDIREYQHRLKSRKPRSLIR